jgi:hypothetical protein
MNVEIKTDTAQFLFGKYIKRIFPVGEAKADTIFAKARRILLFLLNCFCLFLKLEKRQRDGFHLSGWRTGGSVLRSAFPPEQRHPGADHHSRRQM